MLALASWRPREESHWDFFEGEDAQDRALCAAILYENQGLNVLIYDNVNGVAVSIYMTPDWSVNEREVVRVEKQERGLF